MAALAALHAAAPHAAALQQLAYTPAPRKPDVLDKTVTFLAKRDGIDKVPGPPPSCSLPAWRPRLGSHTPFLTGTEGHTLHVQAAAGDRAARLEQRGQRAA